MHSQCMALHSLDGRVLQHTAALNVTGSNPVGTPKSFFGLNLQELYFLNRNSSTTLSLICVDVEVGSGFEDNFLVQLFKRDFDYTVRTVCRSYDSVGVRF